MTPNGTILHVVDHALPEVSGYAVRSHNLLRSLRTAGFDVVAVSSSSRAPIMVEDEIDGVRYVRLPYRLNGEPQTPEVLWKRVVVFGRRLAAEVERRGACLVHAHSPVLNALPALWASRRRQRPLVYEVRGLWEDAALDHDLRVAHDLRYRCSRALESWALRRVDAVTTLSNGLRDEIVRRGVAHERVRLVPNGVDSSAFRPQAADAGLLDRYDLDGRFVVGFIGYFFAYEGVEILIRAFGPVLKDFPQAKLLLVGSGPCETALKAAAQGLGLGASIIFAGEVPHAEVRSYYSVCDVVVYPRLSRRSTEMTTPLKPLEAMAMGKPVVASDIGGLRDLVRDGETGMLYRTDDSQCLAQTLARLATDTTLRSRLGDSGRRYVCEERSWRSSAMMYARLYEELLRAAVPEGR